MRSIWVRSGFSIWFTRRPTLCSALLLLWIMASAFSSLREWLRYWTEPASRSMSVSVNQLIRGGRLISFRRRMHAQSARNVSRAPSVLRLHRLVECRGSLNRVAAFSRRRLPWFLIFISGVNTWRQQQWWQRFIRSIRSLRHRDIISCLPKSSRRYSIIGAVSHA